MKVSYHSVHEPKCGVCQKHCRSLESLREHLIGPLPKANCSKILSEQGCNLCLKVFVSPSSLSEHKRRCYLSAPTPIGTVKMPDSDKIVVNHNCGGPKAVSIDCEMVGGGSDESLDLCARVCLIDEEENVIFHAYVRPEIPITNYRFEITGLTEENLRDALPLQLVQEKILQILYNGESIARARLNGGKARLLVGHALDHDLDCLEITYPNHLLRFEKPGIKMLKVGLGKLARSLPEKSKVDGFLVGCDNMFGTLPIRPYPYKNFMAKIVRIKNKLKALKLLFSFTTPNPSFGVGYDIQTGFHDPYEDCLSAMRLYKRMRTVDHPRDGNDISFAIYHSRNITSNFDSLGAKELQQMTPDELYEISSPNYRCWCLDSSQAVE
ncbi:Apoptosis-enhancing nuclease [Morella rubra]|uniref:Apoptosis-enhancing nuclease n=1 Tax=Morella rubra TaxID=262757 RepID=A0A6A1USJ1_9ROSI|nr:Apoptosis-enhancing nuclease [Morella rubra]